MKYTSGAEHVVAELTVERESVSVQLVATKAWKISIVIHVEFFCKTIKSVWNLPNETMDIPSREVELVVSLINVTMSKSKQLNEPYQRN